MTYKVGDPRAAQSGRRGQVRRWSRSTQEQRAAAAANMQAGKRKVYLESAAEAVKRLGITPTPELIESAATSMQKADLRERAANARATRMTILSDPEAWYQHVHRLAGITVDTIVDELGLRTQPGMPAAVSQHVYGTFRMEADLPHEDRSFQRLRARWEAFRLDLHREQCPFTRWPDADPCLICGCSYGQRAEIA